LLRADAARAARAVTRLVRVPLDQNQFDALVSFTFNVGEGALRDSTLLRELNAGRYDAVPRELNRWTRAGGQVLAGLVRRRAAEGAMFARGRPPAAGTTPPPAPAPTPAPAPAPVRPPAPSSSAEDLRALLGFLRVTEADFAAHETRYFEALRNLLLRRGTIGANEAINRSTFRDAVRRFQRANGLGDDGIPGEDTLWALQVDWANSRNIGLRRVDADLWVRPPRTLANHDPDRDGYNSFNLRDDAAPRYLELRRAVNGAGAIITSSGSFRELTAAVTPGRSATSFHYSGLALDLSTTSGMRDPRVDPFIVTADGDLWRVWARSDQGLEQRLDAVVWANGATRTQTVEARVLDFTALAAGHGFRRIRRRSDFPGNYLSAEWWHFQCEELLVPWISQFGIELLSLQRYTEAHLQAAPRIWENRKKIFKRGRGGWH
jgi:peptidoglycan hydrolase-like protein with peptidoglycan-binding domain